MRKPFHFCPPTRTFTVLCMSPAETTTPCISGNAFRAVPTTTDAIDQIRESWLPPKGEEEKSGGVSGWSRQKVLSLPTRRKLSHRFLVESDLPKLSGIFPVRAVPNGRTTANEPRQLLPTCSSIEIGVYHCMKLASDFVCFLPKLSGGSPVDYVSESPGEDLYCSPEIHSLSRNMQIKQLKYDPVSITSAGHEHLWELE